MNEPVRILPLEWYPGTLSPKDNELFAEIHEFLKQEFDEQHNNLGQYQRVYAAQNEGGKVIGLAGTVVRFDVPMFHVQEPDINNRPAIRDSLLATELLYDRLRHYIEDSGGRGYDVFVYVDPAKQERWGKFLERIEAKLANRWMVSL